MTSLTHRCSEVFSADKYATELTGIEIAEVRECYARCTLKVKPYHRNAMGGVMGGAMFTLADLAFAAAANSRCIEAGGMLEWVSLCSDVRYLAQPKGDMLTAETQCVRQGNSTCLYNILLTDQDGATVAQVTITGIRKRPTK